MGHYGAAFNGPQEELAEDRLPADGAALHVHPRRAGAANPAWCVRPTPAPP